MRAIRTLLFVGATLACAAQLAGAMAVADGADVLAGEQRDFRWGGRVAPGRTVEIKGVNGSVRAEAAAGGEVEVVAEKRGRRSNPDEVRVEVVEHADGVTICAVYPNAGGEPNVCAPGERGRMNVRNNDVSVEFTVRVPAGVRFAGRTVNGSVEARGLDADVVANTVNGSVRAATTGLVRAQTVNGSIDASLGRADWPDALSFETVNGNINLNFPASLSAEVRAETVNGNITTDFPITAQGRIGRRTLNGVIGGGGRELRLKTVNGNLEIRRAS